MYTKRELRYAANIIRRVANENKVSEAQVRTEIESAIKYGRSSPDPAVQARWAAFHYSGAEPAAEEFILWAAWMTKRSMGQTWTFASGRDNYN